MKKIKFLISTLLVAVLFSLTSCGKDEPIDGLSTNTTANTPTTPGTTAGSFQVTYNNATWNATKIQAAIFNNTITILAENAKGESFAIGVIDGTIAGVYPANINQIGFIPAGSDQGYWSLNNANTSENTGSISISSINTSTKTISGTFNFKGYWDDGSKAPIVFTNGIFKDIPFTTTDPNSGTGTPSGTPTTTGFLKKTIETDPDGTVITTNYTYNGNKLVSIIDDSGAEGLYFTYTGDLITKEEFKLPNGTADQVNTFTYTTDGKLATFVRVSVDNTGSIGYKEVYTYNSDGSISVKSYNGDDKTQTQVGGTSVIKFLNGEVSDITSTNSPSFKYSYDAKNDPLKNVIGLNKIAFVDGEANSISHNIISETSNGSVINTAYTYNSDSYPVTATETDSSGKKIITQFFY